MALLLASGEETAAATILKDTAFLLLKVFIVTELKGGDPGEEIVRCRTEFDERNGLSMTAASSFSPPSKMRGEGSKRHTEAERLGGLHRGRGKVRAGGGRNLSKLTSW